jgi:hypothetical protein
MINPTTDVMVSTPKCSFATIRFTDSFDNSVRRENWKEPVTSLRQNGSEDIIYVCSISYGGRDNFSCPRRLSIIIADSYTECCVIASAASPKTPQQQV